MERLTIPDVRVDVHTTRRSMIDVAAVREHAMNFYWRLKAYEDTGMTPEEIKSAFTTDALIKLAAQALETTPDELRGMAKARKDGRLAILPTARGDMLTSEEVSAEQPFFDDVDVSVHYCTSNGMMLFVGYDAFRDWVKNWEIAAANKEAERALEGNG